MVNRFGFKDQQQQQRRDRPERRVPTPGFTTPPKINVQETMSADAGSSVVEDEKVQERINYSETIKEISDAILNEDINRINKTDQTEEGQKYLQETLELLDNPGEINKLFDDELKSRLTNTGINLDSWDEFRNFEFINSERNRVVSELRKIVEKKIKRIEENKVASNKITSLTSSVQNQESSGDNALIPVYPASELGKEDDLTDKREKARRVWAEKLKEGATRFLSDSEKIIDDQNDVAALKSMLTNIQESTLDSYKRRVLNGNDAELDEQQKELISKMFEVHKNFLTEKLNKKIEKKEGKKKEKEGLSEEYKKKVDEEVAKFAETKFGITPETEEKLKKAKQTEEQFAQVEGIYIKNVSDYFEAAGLPLNTSNDKENKYLKTEKNKVLEEYYKSLRIEKSVVDTKVKVDEEDRFDDDGVGMAIGQKRKDKDENFSQGESKTPIKNQLTPEQREAAIQAQMHNLRKGGIFSRIGNWFSSEETKKKKEKELRRKAERMVDRNINGGLPVGYKSKGVFGRIDERQYIKNEDRKIRREMDRGGDILALTEQRKNLLEIDGLARLDKRLRKAERSENIKRIKKEVLEKLNSAFTTKNITYAALIAGGVIIGIWGAGPAAMAIAAKYGTGAVLTKAIGGAAVGATISGFKNVGDQSLRNEQTEFKRKELLYETAKGGAIGGLFGALIGWLATPTGKEGTGISALQGGGGEGTSGSNIGTGTEKVAVGGVEKGSSITTGEVEKAGSVTKVAVEFSPSNISWQHIDSSVSVWEKLISDKATLVELAKSAGIEGAVNGNPDELRKIAEFIDASLRSETLAGNIDRNSILELKDLLGSSGRGGIDSVFKNISDGQILSSERIKGLVKFISENADLKTGLEKILGK